MSNLKRFLSLTLAMLMVVGAMATVSAKTFADVADTDPYAEAVDVLSELGVIAGATTTEFAPDALVERQQMAMFIARLATAKPAWFAVEAAPVYADQTAPVYNAAIAYANTNGIIVGRTATTFDGAASVSLQEAATMMCRALGYYSNAMNAAYPMSYLMMADEIGLLAGLEDVTPTAALTRGEVAIMLYNAFDAKMAKVELVYGPNGYDRIVTVPADADAKKLSDDKWKVTTVNTYLEATKDFSFMASAVPTTKTLTDPVKFDGVTGTYSFADVAKFFPEDAVANDYLGVDLDVYIRNGSILSIKVIGDVVTTGSASFVADTNVVTVDGTAYDLDAYPIVGTYPDASDNCFYIYNGSNIERVDNVTDVSAIVNGWFQINVINGGEATQRIVYKPLTFGQVTDANADGALEVGGVVITDNTLGAKKDDFVTYFTNGVNLVEVKGVAVKSAGQKVVTINNTSKIATFDTGATAPFGTAPIDGHIILPTLSIGSSYYTYSVDGKVLKTEAVAAPATTYAPKAYYKVLDSDVVTGEFSAETHIIKVVDAAGAESVKAITKFNATAVNTYADAAAFATAVEGKVITIDASDATIVYDATTADNFFTTFNSVADTKFGVGTTDPITFFKSGNMFTITDSAEAPSTTSSFVLADYSKIVVKATDGYVVVNGKSFAGFNTAATVGAVGSEVAQTLSNVYTVLHKNVAGIDELVYAYVETDATKADVVDGGTTTTTLKPYVFLGIEEETALTVKYNVFNLINGTVEQLTYTVADDAAKTALKGAIATATDAAISAYDVQSSTAAPSTTLGLTTPLKFASGYVVTAGTPYTTNDTKFYQWDATNDVFVAKTAADFTVGKSYEGIIILNGANADYVIVRAETITTAVTTAPNPAAAIDVDTEVITLTSEADATIYYTLDGTDPTTDSDSIVSGNTVTIPAGGAVGDTVTIKAFAVIAGENASAIATFTYTR